MRKVNTTIVKPFITSDDIFNSTNKGLDIFERELGKINLHKNISNPFKTDKNPSARIKQSSKSGLYILNCYDNGEYFNGIQFIQRKYGMDFKDAISHIANNCTINTFIPIIQEKEEKIAEKVDIDYVIIPFNDCHKEYFLQGGLTEDYLNEQHIYAISKYEMFNKVYNCKCSFVYEYVDENGEILDFCKILNLNVNKEYKWRTNLANNMFWGLDTIQDNTKVVICKSYKDTVLLRKYGYCVITPQSENSVTFIQSFPKLKEDYPDVTEWVLLFGIDEDGYKKAEEIVTEFSEIKNFKLPMYYWNIANDPFEIYKTLGEDKFKLILETL